MVKVGDVVRVVKGKAAGSVGKVFWVGDSKFGPRVGLKPDGGDKVWANPDHVVLDAPAPAPVSLVALAAALDAPPTAPASDAVLALTARVAALELLVGKLMAGAPAPVAAPKPVASDLFDPPFFDEPPPPYGEN